MAHSYTVTTSRLNNNEFRVVIVETGCGAADECELPGLPPTGTVVRQTTLLQNGSATTVDPILGAEADPAGVGNDSVVCENEVPANPADNQGAASYASEATPQGDAGGVTLYHRSRPNEGSNNAITTKYLLKAGF